MYIRQNSPSNWSAHTQTGPVAFSWQYPPFSQAALGHRRGTSTSPPSSSPGTKAWRYSSSVHMSAKHFKRSYHTWHNCQYFQLKLGQECIMGWYRYMSHIEYYRKVRIIHSTMMVPCSRNWIYKFYISFKNYMKCNTTRSYLIEAYF